MPKSYLAIYNVSYLYIVNNYKQKKQKQMSNYYNTEYKDDPFPWKEFIMMVIFMIILPTAFLILMKPQ